MLKSTFLHLKGISKKKEKHLWAKGILSWKDYKSYFGEQLTIFDDDETDHALSESETAYENSNIAFFGDLLPTSDYYRVALEYPEDVIFLDIETTGLSLYYDKITIVGWSKGSDFGIYINGQDDKLLRSALASAKIMVTFNGIMFDLKFLNKHFKGLKYSRKINLTF